MECKPEPRYELQVGDVVHLASGGAKVTVESVWPSGRIGVTWFDGKNHLHRARVPADSVRLYVRYGIHGET